MPFGREFDDLWKLGIRDTLVNLGCICERGDDIRKPGLIVWQIQQQIIKADLVIADLTGQNPNVLYELGWAHAFERPTVLCASASADLTAFDTRGYRSILHQGIAHILRDQLNDVVPELLKSVAPLPVGADLVWSWPSDVHDPPQLKFEADPKKNGGRVQGDLFGGQSIKPATNGEPMLVITDTIKNWNNRPERSVARLLHKSTAFRMGDKIIVDLIARTDREAVFELIGDGAKISAGVRVWARVFQIKTARLASPLWKHIQLESVVAPTEGGQDPAAFGVTVHIRTRAEGHVFVRQITIHRQVAVLGAGV